MADTTTTAYGLTKPEIGASEDSWGQKLNDNLDDLDSTIDAIGGKTGAGTLKYADAAKLATTSNGVDVTGTVTADGLTVDGSGILSDTNSGAVSSLLALHNEGTESGTVAELKLAGGNGLSTRYAYIRAFNSGSSSGNAHALFFGTNASSAAPLNRMSISSGGDISFYEDTGTTPKLFWDASAEALGIGTTSPSSPLEIQTTGSTTGLNITSPASSILTLTSDDDATAGGPFVANIKGASNGHLLFEVGGSERLRIDSSGNVGIGTESPSTYGGSLNVVGDAVGGESTVVVANSSTSQFIRMGVNADQAQIAWDNGDALVFGYADNSTVSGLTAERMRIDSSGNLLVGTTNNVVYSTGGASGITIRNDGLLGASRDGNASAAFNRNTSDGSIVQFRQGGSPVGNIGNNGGNIYIAGDNSGILFGVNAGIMPTDSLGSTVDNSKDIGAASIRWDDIYATNGTIQTSDRNEKQQIADLTAAEMQAATAISKLFKTFKWNDSVAEKGDDARIHTGVIAQDVEQAMTDAGLDAGRYAFFISSTWWESTEVIPAVEAVEAVEAVYEDVIIPAVLDEEGNEIEAERTEQRLVSEAVEAVEAQPERTVTHTHMSADEAPEGAVERTRKGIRYPQLLAFVGAATEQRLASIEARLDAAGM